MDTRQLTRKKLQQQRAKISLSEQKKTSAIITEQLSQHPLFYKADQLPAIKLFNMKLIHQHSSIKLGKISKLAIYRFYKDDN